MQTIDKGLVAQGDQLTYTIKVTNKGPQEVKHAEVYDDPDSQESDVSVHDTLSQCTAISGFGGFDCFVDLHAGQTDTITYAVTVNDTVSDGDTSGGRRTGSARQRSRSNPPTSSRRSRRPQRSLAGARSPRRSS
jgi:uncharacterized repeat protein (TIGR01451 family)